MWMPREIAVAYTMLSRLDRIAEASALLERAFERYPKSWDLLMLMANHVLAVDPDAAVALLETAAAPPRKRWRQERAHAVSLLVRLQTHSSMADELSPLSREQRGALMALDSEAERRLEQTLDSLARSDVLYVRARVAGRLGRSEDRLRWLRDALSAAPSSARPVLDLAFLAFLVADDDPVLAGEALPHLDRILDRGFRGQRASSRTELFRALYLRGVLRFVVGQYGGSVQDLDDVLQFAEDDERLEAALADPARFVYFARVRDSAAAQLK